MRWHDLRMVDDPSPPEQVMPFAAFAATLRPQVASVRTIAPRNGPPRAVNVMSKGSPDEIWLCWLRIKHGAEKHTKTAWQKLIKDYAKQPAHPADANFKPGG